VSRAVDERRASFQRYKEDVDRRGKQFHPYAMFHDTVMSLVVVSVIVGLACVWYLTAEEVDEGASKPGWLGVLYEDKADPGTTSFTPRPDWYFYFLFYLLRIFKWPDTVVLGTVGIPTILLIIALVLPFLDRRMERRPLRRPVAIITMILTAISMGVLTYKGATAEEGTGALADVPIWIERNNLPEDVRPGAEIVAQIGCLTCHVYVEAGVSNLGAPELTGIGAEQGRDVNYLQRYVANPREFGNTVMPTYGENLNDEQLRQVAEFLEASKGEN
jgi:quinol---cytochrome c reductase cytochrome c subunit, bacillus type